MKKIALTSVLNNIKTQTKEGYTLNDLGVEVLSYLPLLDKYTLINITLQDAFDGSIYHPVKIEGAFYVYVAILYTNITFTEKQKTDIFKTYDLIMTSGLLNMILNNIPEEEFNTLLTLFKDTLTANEKYAHSFTSMVNKFADQIASKAAELQDQVKDIDSDKIQNTVDLVKRMG
jgi:hypothetical protein